MLRLVINLDRSPDRLQLIKDQLDQLSLSFERIQAFDGKSFNPSDIESIKPNLLSLNKIWFPYHLINTEYACFLSHRKCWERLLDSTEDYAVILEDDVELASDAIMYLANSDWIPKHIHLIQLCAPFSSPQILYAKKTTYSLEVKEFFKII